MLDYAWIIPLLPAASFLIILLGLIVLHEAGHYFTAKLFGVKVLEAGIGLPPRIWGFTWRGTDYTINALPFGAFVRMLGEEENDTILSAAIWSLSQIGGEDVRTYLENLLDQLEDDEQIAFLEEALDNLAFTEDLDRFDLLAYDPDEELTELDEDEDK